MTAPIQKSRSALPFVLAFIAGAIGTYWFNGEPRKDEVKPDSVLTAGETPSGFSKALAKGPLAGLIVHAARKPIPDFSFSNDKGETTTLNKWKGRVVLLNLWATWCAPCRKEMPDLSKLQASLGGPDFEVVALSVDRKGLEASKAFLAETGVTNLGAYIEPEAKSLAALQALGLPATILIDRQGQEAARLLGPADWASQEAQDMVKALLAEK
jgi:thiol-disulfide isomerase/thioredoxin